MTALDICSTFLVIRLKLEMSDEELKKELCKLFGARGIRDFVQALNDKFQVNDTLERKYRGWRNSYLGEVLTEDEVYTLLGASKLHSFSTSTNVFPSAVCMAFIELLPVVVCRFGEDFKACTPLSAC